ncbi:MAG: hypothetical protein M3O31_00295 [Acidobacteriota bacterium]|nr:hypothetical protein [Acidobacteriota bacterium]
MVEVLTRFLIGGVVVSIFSMLGEILRPKSFAGLLGAAPSIALATLGLTVHHNGKEFASLEARSMILGGLAFCFYAATVGWLLRRYRPSTIVATVALMPIWFGVCLSCAWLIARSPWQ